MVLSSYPIEVWLHTRPIGIAGFVVFADESTQDLTLESLDMRGAQREVTSHYRAHGYAPSGRWSLEAAMPDGALETMRQFKPRRVAGLGAPSSSVESEPVSHSV